MISKYVNLPSLTTTYFRFIPNRGGGVDLTTTFNLLSESHGKTPALPASPGSAKRKIHRGPETDAQKGQFVRLLTRCRL